MMMTIEVILLQQRMQEKSKNMLKSNFYFFELKGINVKQLKFQ